MTIQASHTGRSGDTRPALAVELRTLDDFRNHPRPLPSWSDDDAWTAELVAVDIARVPMPPHTMVHPRPQHGCPLCPPVPCVCGAEVCGLAFEHRRASAGSETTWREAAA